MSEFCRVLNAQCNARTNWLLVSDVQSFCSQNGPDSGRNSKVYYAAYVYFEKLRIKHGKGKSDERKVLESFWEQGALMNGHSVEAQK